MNIAIILAGGMGSRTMQDIPKQFMNVYEKPIIIYTLENFQKNELIDAIEVVCLEGWHEILQAYAKQYNITKLKWIISGGDNGQQSIQNGIEALDGTCSDEDIVLIHDAIRPYVPQEIIDDCIMICREYGSGLSSIRCQETMVHTIDGVEGIENIERSNVMRVQTPQAYQFKKAKWAYEQALLKDIHNEVYINTLMLHLGEKVFFSKGTQKNIKITTMDDVELFKALMKTENEEWIRESF